MNRYIAPAAWILAAIVALLANSAQAEPVDYERDVKPILKARCYACHGGLQQKAGLRLDTAVSVLRGGESGSIVDKSEPAKSLLLTRVATSEIEERMPPEFEGEALSAEQIAVLRAWIEAGASAPQNEKPEADPREHWAFRPIVRPTVPQVRRADWTNNPIDAFVAHKHEQLGLEPVAEASKLLLLRRLSLDLIGLPPTAAEIAAFERDNGPDAYERAVTRLLNDPRHGERWARHWMDIWRYSDWWGLGEQLRNSQPHIWHWRDWMVESLNADTPYDEMVRLMLAADELHPNDLDKLRASGYLARNYFLFNRHQWMDETVEHVSKAFLGLTTNCAKCHDHKFDPISQTDYYRLRAFFEPYHVRIDMLPGEADLARDGLPRAFDAVLDAPTYLLIRGDESKPDKSVAIPPGVPSALEFAPLNIEPVELPGEAWQPQKRAWVAEAYQAAARQKLAAAEAKLSPAREKLVTAERKEAALLAKLKTEPSTPKEVSSQPLADAAQIVEKFATLDKDRWKLFGGEWLYAAGKLEQKRDGASRAALRLMESTPRNFDATLRFTILGGSQWRSVGIAFDSTQADPTAEATADDSEQSVYVSAHAGGPKVQAAYQRAGKSQYPTEALAARSVELKKEYTLRVQVRDNLINAALNGEPTIAWRTPLTRRDGSFLIMTFDAIAVLHEVTIAPLQADLVLREPGTPTTNSETPAGAARAVAAARMELQVAELAIGVAQAEERSVAQRAAADAGQQPARDAARAERERAAAQARLALAEAELRLQRAAMDKQEAVKKEVATARETLAKASQKVDEPSEQYTAFVGAQWSATRFLNSGKDDPAIAFPPRSTGRRQALANWITDRRNPLTARVAVNHLWTRHFGTPLVPTVFDFGRNGQPPPNAALLDWLAAELIESGWSMKHLHRLMVESATYRLSSSAGDAKANLAVDPDNWQHWRRTPTRLESQAVRDSILALAGTLDLSRGGPPVPVAGQSSSLRRSLYFFHSNNERNLFLTMFDEALVKECYRRDQSIVPQQALTLTNSKLVLDAVPIIAQRLTRDLAEQGQAMDSDEQFVRLAFAVLLAAEPSQPEIAASVQALEAWEKLPEAGQGDAAQNYARGNLIWVIVNHNDFVTLR
ncbi:MAG TPA: PSD1 and planctomycete cytochrome C domain-containing protein [Pirellulaceae bacterium]|nr:PSD1 and planctomycete cytochrome C domain-containing protein [Pirellulaceae bacterium]